MKTERNSNRNLNKLISLTFDESPEVRIKAAESLAGMDDPAALFALLELSYDKVPEVRKKAQEILDEKKKEEKDVLSFAEIFSREEKKERAKVIIDKKEKILSPITSLFERTLGKEKAEKVKAKMMPTIEKIYRNSTAHGKIVGDQGKEVIQEFLTNYLEAVSGINNEGEIELEEVGTKERKFDKISKEISEIELASSLEIEEEDPTKDLPDSFFKRAYETMALSNGDEEIMKREMKRMLLQAERDVKLAFRIARNKFRERKIVNITKIRDGMRNINTDVLTVKEVENVEYRKSRKQTSIATRIVVNDENGNEGVVYLLDGRGEVLKPDMKIKIVKGYAKTFDFSGETALTVGKRGNVYIVL